MDKKEEKEVEYTCEGYLRAPHNSEPVLYRMYPDGTTRGLCQTCATRFLLSDDEFPPKKERIK